MPPVCWSCRRQGRIQTSECFFIRMHGYPGLDLGQFLRALTVKVTRWNEWILGGLAAKETVRIAAIFQQKSVRIIFRVALEKQEQAASFPHKGINARSTGSRQHLIATIC